jgi:hypothetical protein
MWRASADVRSAAGRRAIFVSVSNSCGTGLLVVSISDRRRRLTSSQLAFGMTLPRIEPPGASLTRSGRIP